VMSLWLSPRDAVAVVLPVLIATDLVGIRAWRGKADWPDLRRLLAGALLGVVVGALAFGVMSDRMIKLFVGLIAVVFAADKILRRKPPAPAPQRPGGHWFGIICGAVSGFTSTLAHAGGPPVILYLLRQKIDRQTFVASTVYFFTFLNLAKLPFYLALGIFTRDTLIMSALLIPLVPIGVWTGLRVLALIPERVFFVLTTLALGLSGLKLVWDGLAG
ncbi:MAG: sulfite exporter TauE/SafE family protein, partial [Rhodocyclaceae bacterium]|nr:sulfite exporter TauE/SafE family protein [Rhodocyclaceae bacterium]